MRVFNTLGLFLIVLFLNGCESEDLTKLEPKYSSKKIFQREVYIFGVHPLHNPKHLFRVYQPMIDFINQNLNRKDIYLKLEASRNYAEYDKKLFTREFHFSLPNPYQTVTSLKSGYRVFGKMGDDENFRGVIITRKDSNISKVTDLKNKIVSYPAPTALAATMMPQWFLYQNGIDINEDIENIYVGSQESSIMNVYMRKSVAGSTWPPPWEAFKKARADVAKELEVKWVTQPLPNNGLVVRDDIDRDLVREVGEIIFNLHTHKRGREILKPMELSKFERANADSYAPVVAFLEKFKSEVRDIRIQK